MKTTGIICEYNPFHRGHEKQIDYIRTQYPDDGVVCLMSGRFVQRGHPAMFAPEVRARAALLSGADLVLELPVNVSLASAEGFADGGVEILSRVGVDRLCFGAETREEEKLTQAVQVLLSGEFSEVLHRYLDMGLSFPTARSKAAAQLGADPEVLTRPNDILAVEYAKAVYGRGGNMTLMPIHRGGDYHDQKPDRENPSATALRRMILGGEEIRDYVPQEVESLYARATVYALHWGEKAILGKLRAMEEREFESIPYGAEGLWRKLMHESRRQNTLEEILAAVKSKRYTRSRLDRMVMCAFLGLTAEKLAEPAPYVRILAMNRRGRAILRQRNSVGYFVNLGKHMEDDYARQEEKLIRLYGLFAREVELETPRQRVILAEE